MKKNVGNTDKIIRVLAALVFAVLYFTGTVTGMTGIFLLILAAIFIVTSFVSFCPIYALFGLRSFKDQKA